MIPKIEYQGDLMKKILMLIAVMMLLFIAGCGNTESECDNCIPVNNVDSFCKDSGYVPVQDVNELIDITTTLINGTNEFFNASIENVVYYEVPE